ncbi:hypothetical protein [Enhygromyxa salina]|uniref:hypothetical protein n=1 Tax=Enhygromyxa salina TaxID=215803 RepID=UPI0030B7F5AD
MDVEFGADQRADGGSETVCSLVQILVALEPHWVCREKPGLGEFFKRVFWEGPKVLVLDVGVVMLAPTSIELAAFVTSIQVHYAGPTAGLRKLPPPPIASPVATHEALHGAENLLAFLVGFGGCITCKPARSVDLLGPVVVLGIGDGSEVLELPAVRLQLFGQEPQQPRLASAVGAGDGDDRAEAGQWLVSDEPVLAREFGIELDPLEHASSFLSALVVELGVEAQGDLDFAAQRGRKLGIGARRGSSGWSRGLVG